MTATVLIHKSLGAIWLPLLLALAAGPALANQVASPAAAKAPREMTPQKLMIPPPTLVERLRRLLNIAPPVAVGGSRSGSRQSVCLLAPWITPATAAAEAPAAEVLTAEPTLLSSGTLDEVRLIDQGTVIWRLRTTSSEPIKGPIRWPLAPLRGGERLRLVLRPEGSAGGDVAVVNLLVARAAELQANERRIAALGTDQQRWIASIEQLAPRRPALAMALLTNPKAPPELQRAARELRCR